jgi:hypothetical protein
VEWFQSGRPSGIGDSLRAETSQIAVCGPQGAHVRFSDYTAIWMRRASSNGPVTKMLSA